MKDFYYKIKDAEKKEDIKKLIKDYSADPGLDYEISSKVITISSDAFFASKSGRKSLEYIFNKSLGEFEYQTPDEKGIFLATEIAFTGIFDPKNLYFHEFIIGKTGNKDMCSWIKGNLLKLSQKKAINGKMIALGHTHPVIVPEGDKPRREYGAICSKIYWKEKELKDFGNSISLKQLETEIYKKYGGDYSEMWTLAKEKEKISNFALIMSPALNQLGIFEIKKHGKIIYYKWKIK